MQCIQCLQEFTSQRATAKFCSVKCKLKYNRLKVSVSNNPVSVSEVSVSSPKVSVSQPENATLKVSVSSAVSELKLSVASAVPTPENPSENSTPNFSKYTAEELYIGINSYELDLWAKSPEYKELIKRLDKLSIKQLREQGFQIPLWKLNNQPCPF